MSESNPVVLDVNNLSVEFDTYGGTVKAVRDVSFQLKQGQTLAIVGESGSGKSVTVQSIMGLIPMPPGRITAGSAKFKGEELIGLSDSQLNAYRGKRIGMIFQDAMSALNPTMTIGKQIAETLIVHEGLSRAEAYEQAIKLLHQTQIPEAEKRAKQYPFEFSGGMLQRVMIAMSIACKPDVLIADEPTTALDVTIQAQILSLLKQLQEEHQLSIILITHDLGVVAKMAHEVAVMYAGQIVEIGSADDIFYQSAHPYTLGLKKAMPSNKELEQTLTIIDGSPPDLFSPPKGCGFSPRCSQTMKVCQQHPPPKIQTSPGHSSNCWLLHEQAPENDLKQDLLGPSQ